jgi:AcrR family transcriptional regulator
MKVPAEGAKAQPIEAAPKMTRESNRILFRPNDDPVALDLLAARPDDEHLAETLRAVIRETLAGLYRHDPERLLTRVRLASTVPELRARFLDAQTDGIEQLKELLDAKRRARVDDLSLRVLGSAMLAAVSVALDAWQRSDGKADLLALLDRATDALAMGARELSAAPAKARA